MKCAYCLEEIEDTEGNLINWVRLTKLIEHFFICQEIIKHTNIKLWKRDIENIIK